MVLEVVHHSRVTATTIVILVALVGVGPTLSVTSGFYFFVGIIYHFFCV